MEQRGFVFLEKNLLSPAQAVATFLTRVAVAPRAFERVRLEDACGRVLAEHVLADADYPMAPRSAMDGFAIAAERAPGSFSIVGAIAMGHPWGSYLAPGQAVRIPTGGVVPDGADAVVAVEDARLAGSQVVYVDDALDAGTNVNPPAGDMRAGTRVLEAGTRIGGPQMGVLATLGITLVPVFPRPRIAVISSGDELVPPAMHPSPAQVRDSNRHAIAGALQGMGAQPFHGATVSDVPGALERALRRALAEADAAIVTGGSSVGDADRTPAAINALGAPGVIVHGLRVKPGKPTALGAAGSKPVIGLPGNPTSALVILEAVLAPIIGALAGAPVPIVTVPATLAGEVRTRAGWTWYVPVRLEPGEEGWRALPLALRSSVVSLTAAADGYVIAPEETETLEMGSRVAVHRFI
ncbi:MAG TPA: molybdopterin molybdotransferase MoeA [Candidatus Baltobacteraceae bacterium]|nr:molybdopterin molybdotransferase MoeA [Candidatus Baltobacteraceae bacterium]